MRFFEWNNQYVGDYDIFMLATKEEMLRIVGYFGTQQAQSCTFDPQADDAEYYYFINSKEKSLTPMPRLSLAFGGMYNGYPPYGDEKPDFSFTLEDYRLLIYESGNIK